jgi:hypothetical protein
VSGRRSTNTLPPAMGTGSLKCKLASASDSLLGLRTSCDQHAAALAQLETLVASLVLDPQHPLLTAFLRFQDSFDRNSASNLASNPERG